ncbi:MAG: 3-phosphoserine/phosphohydroxythreonine transaminase [Pseudomonadales bacterium]|nr:3-phosphoserine/phosphohydroxythreonine transaminase [Pseudomonadales bacterium]
MSRKFNFCAGPAALPEAVLTKAQGEMLDWHGRGLSVMEMSHRSEEFVAIAEGAETALRKLMNISDEFAVLFVQGGATQQFSAVPMNLLGDKAVANYVNTGQWSKKAIKEASKYCEVNVAATSEAENFSCIPSFDSWNIDRSGAYLHYTPNETIGGVEFFWVPQVDMPIVADMSSTILSRPIDVNQFDVIYAGAQKNIGPSGLTLVIARRALLGNAHPLTPSMLDYKVHDDAGSMSNTPPAYAWYMAGLVFDWLLEQGGLAAMEAINLRKSSKLYNFIDAHDFYANPVEIASRSRMNVPFTLADSGLDKAFLSGAEERGLLNLKGHRSVGGMRASIYNAVPEAAVDALIGYMQEFAAANA